MRKGGGGVNARVDTQLMKRMGEEMRSAAKGDHITGGV